MSKASGSRWWPLVVPVAFFPAHRALAGPTSAIQWSARETTSMLPEDPDHPEQSDVKNFPAVVQLFSTDAANITDATAGVNCTGSLFRAGPETRLYTAAHCFVMAGNKQPQTARLTHVTADANGNAIPGSSPPFAFVRIEYSQSFAARRSAYHWVGANNYGSYDSNIRNILFPDGHIADDPSDVAYAVVPTSANVDGWSVPLPKFGHQTTPPDTLLVLAGGCDQPGTCYTGGAKYKIKYGHFAVVERLAKNKLRAVPSYANLSRPGDSGGPAFSATNLGMLDGVVSAGRDGSSDTLINEVAF